MFYQFTDALREVSAEGIDSAVLTAGFIGKEEAGDLCRRFNFADAAVEALRNANERFRSGVEVYDDYTFTELRIADAANPEAADDCVALFLKKNLFIVVDVEDHDGSTRNKFLSAIRRYPAKAFTLEKLIFAFLDALVANETQKLEETGMRIADLEEDIFEGRADKDFNHVLLKLKKHLLKMHNYYEQLLDITGAIDENENEIFESESLMYIINLSQKITRLREDCDSLSNMLSHMQDAYSAQLDLQLNKTMKIFTVITSIFFPLTVIVGWYGMNFTTMPEFTWKYGYLYVILLSVVTVILLTLLGKRKKWF